MARSAKDGAGRPGRWRRAVWGTAGFLWLLVLVANQAAAGVNLVDVSVILLIPTGLYELALALGARSAVYRAAVGIALAAASLLVLVNGAVGIIGSENQSANQLYAGVLVVGITVGAIARFRPHGMTIALFATALAQLSVPVLALVIWQSQLSWGGAGMPGVLVLNAFFATLFLASALLFRSAARRDPNEARPDKDLLLTRQT